MSNLICGVHHIALHTSDLEKSIKFYTEVLGFKLERTWRNGDNTKTLAMVDVGGNSKLELFSDCTGKTQYPTEAGSYVHLAFRCSDPKAAFDKCIAYGCEPHINPKEMVMPSEVPYPVALAFVKGPDGELIEFFLEK